MIKKFCLLKKNSSRAFFALSLYEFADSFPQSPFAVTARAKLGAGGRIVPQGVDRDSTGDSTAFAAHTGDDDSLFYEGQPADSGAAPLPPTNDPQYAYYFRGDDTLILLTLQPIRTEEPFDFPQEAYNIEWNDFILYFQLHLDFSGKVDDYLLKTPSGNDEIDRRVKRHVETSTFNPQQIRGEFQGTWFVWKFIVSKPEHLRR